MTLGLGTAAIGRPLYINIGKKSSNKKFNLEEYKNQGKELLEYAFQQGIQYFDTAPGYGMAEQMLLEWISTKNNQKLKVATKWGYTYVANFNPKATIHEVKEHSLGKLNEQWEVSKGLLSNLKIYQIHSATLESGVLENKAVLERLAEIKELYGVEIGMTSSGDNQNEILKKAFDVHINEKQLFDSFQVTYNIFDQSFLELKEQFYLKKIIIKEALANGRVFPNQKFTHYNQHYILLQKLAEKYNCGIDAIALRFCMDSVQPFSVLSGASSKKQVQENLLSEKIILNTEEIQQLKELKVSPELYWIERKKLTWN